MAQNLTDVQKAVEQTVTESGLFLEDMTVKTSGRSRIVRVIVDLPDGPGGVSSDQLDAATRAVSTTLDDLDPFPGAYTLEVSTPGITRPLVTPRHFRRAQGRKVSVTTDGATVTGILHSADDDTIVVDETSIPVSTITTAAMVVDFGGK